MFSKKLVVQEKYFDANFSDRCVIRPTCKKYVISNNKELSDIISTINKITPSTKSTPDNLTRDERKALNEMKDICRSSIIIKKADKSNTLVLMEKNDYENKLVLEGHLHTPTYEKAPDDANKKVFSKIKTLCKKHSSCITDNERKVIENDDWSESQFYVLPKLHKCKSVLDNISQHDGEYIQMSFPDDLKGRPINGDVNSVTHGLSKLLDKILNPLLHHLKSFVKDEYDFLRKFPKKTPADTKILCFDITSLYTSIPIDLGMKALDYWLTKLSSSIDSRFTKQFILECVHFILEKYYFQFNSIIWHQRTGAPMGKSFVSPYACLTVGYLEETILFPILLPRYFEKTIVDQIIEFFYRYIDNNCAVFPASVTAGLFLQILNKMDTTIQYTGSTPAFEKVDDILYQCNNFLSIKISLILLVW